MAVGFAVSEIPVHRGQRRDAEPLDVLAQEERGLDVHDARALRALHDEADRRRRRSVRRAARRPSRCRSPAAAVSKQKWVKSGNSSVLPRTADVDREAAGREAVLVELADGAEIGRAEEGDPVVLRQSSLPLRASCNRKPAKPALSGSCGPGNRPACRNRRCRRRSRAPAPFSTTCMRTGFWK